jgi:hypothetical protein
MQRSVFVPVYVCRSKESRERLRKKGGISRGGKKNIRPNKEGKGIGKKRTKAKERGKKETETL